MLDTLSECDSELLLVFDKETSADCISDAEPDVALLWLMERDSDVLGLLVGDGVGGGVIVCVSDALREGVEDFSREKVTDALTSGVTDTPVFDAVRESDTDLLFSSVADADTDAESTLDVDSETVPLVDGVFEKVAVTCAVRETLTLSDEVRVREVLGETETVLDREGSTVAELIVFDVSVDCVNVCVLDGVGVGGGVIVDVTDEDLEKVTSAVVVTVAVGDGVAEGREIDTSDVCVLLAVDVGELDSEGVTLAVIEALAVDVSSAVAVLRVRDSEAVFSFDTVTECDPDGVREELNDGVTDATETVKSSDRLGLLDTDGELDDDGVLERVGDMVSLSSSESEIVGVELSVLLAVMDAGCV